MKKFYLSILLAAGAFTAANAQDVITKCSGEEINAKVVEINNSEIKYKKYDNQNGVTYVISKSEVFMIHYEGGDKDVFKCGETQPNSNGGKDDDKSSSSVKYKKNAFGLDIGVGYALIDDQSAVGTTIGLRYLHNFSQYFGADFISFNPVFATDGTLFQFMTGVRGYTKRFGKKMNKCGYGSFKIGGGFVTPYMYGGVSIAPEIGVHISNTFFMGLSYNVFIVPDYLALHLVALRLGFHFGR